MAVNNDLHSMTIRVPDHDTQSENRNITSLSNVVTNTGPIIRSSLLNSHEDNRTDLCCNSLLFVTGGSFVFRDV